MRRARGRPFDPLPPKCLTLPSAWRSARVGNVHDMGDMAKQGNGMREPREADRDRRRPPRVITASVLGYMFTALSEIPTV